MFFEEFFRLADDVFGFGFHDDLDAAVVFHQLLFLELFLLLRPLGDGASWLLPLALQSSTLC